MKNYYELLEITQDASKLQIKEAYRKLVKKYHPDKNNGHPAFEEFIKDLNEANEVLSDHFRKLEYDQELSQYNLSKIFNPDNLPTTKIDFLRQEQRKVYIRKTVKTSVTFVALFGLLGFFMFYLFPIQDNEWEMAHKTETVSNSYNDVDDLFGKEASYVNTETINSKKDSKDLALEEGKIIDMTGPEVIAAPAVVTQSFAGADIKPVEAAVVKPAPKPVEKKVVVAQPLEVIIPTVPAKPVEKKIAPVIAAPKTIIKKRVIASANYEANIEKPAIKVIGVNPSVQVRKRVTKHVARNLSSVDMTRILIKLEAASAKYNNRIKCITLGKTSTSNIVNAFMIADFLNSHGYVISGRKIVYQNIKGIQVDAKSGCITLVIGSM